MPCQDTPDLKLPRKQQHLRKVGSQISGLTKIRESLPSRGGTQLDLLFPRRDC